MSDDKEFPKKVAAESIVKKFRVRLGMAALLRDVAGHNWGWFSDEDERMHVQTVDEQALYAPKKVKFWLENQGRRIFELAEGDLKGGPTKELKAKVDEERRRLESRWVVFMIGNGWLRADLEGSIVTLTAYPGHNSYTKTLDLRERFPGAYKAHPSWDTVPIYVTLDQQHCALAVGPDKRAANRNHIRLPDLLFRD
jgi:hypothetical protein